MNNKQAIKSFIVYRWHVFLLIFLMSAAFYYYLFTLIKNPSLNETVKIFIATNQVEVTALENKLNHNIDSTKIKKIAIDYSDPQSNHFSTVFQTRGLVQTDLILMDETTLEAINYPNLFTPLLEPLLTNYFETTHLSYLMSDQQKYGILLTETMLEFISHDEQLNYYVLINKDSSKMANLNEDNVNDYGLLILKNLLGL